jgi:hypothetical protein
MEKIANFLRIDNLSLNSKYGDGGGYGDGDGNGDGYGNGGSNGGGNGDGGINGYGYGDGNGDGDGYGYGYGDSYGNSYGKGDGNGLKSINNQPIYLIDEVQTIIISVKNNIAKGFIVESDLNLNPYYIAKGENEFAHGKTIKEAVEQLQQKLLESLSTDERIIKFKEHFNSVVKKYKASEYYNWHTTLTGSCDMGKKSFVKDRNIDLSKDKFTIKEFIELVKNSYNSTVILQLEKEYNS